MWTFFSICMASKPIFIFLKSAVDKQLQISPKSNGLFWQNLGWVMKLFSYIIWVLLNQPNCFINKSVLYFFSYIAKFSPKSHNLNILPSQSCDLGTFYILCIEILISTGTILISLDSMILISVCKMHH